MGKITDITEFEYMNIISIQENDYNDYKSKLKKPSDLVDDIIGFANAEGGTLYIGVNQNKDKNGKVIGFEFDGFDSIEEANDFISLYNETIPTIIGLGHEFLRYKNKYILKYIIPKSQNLHSTKSGKYFIRLGARTNQIKPDDIEQIKYFKGISKYEECTKDINLELLLNSKYFKNFMEKENTFGSKLTGYEYLNQNNFIDKSKNPRISAILGFLDNPQVHQKASIVITVYGFQKNTRQYKYDRDKLVDTKKVVGPIEEIILEAIMYIEKFFNDKKVKYPIIAIKEALVNAVVHREYSIQDDIKIEIFDNQIEITNPGLFPGFTRELDPRKYQRNIRNSKIYWIVSRVSDFEKNVEKKLNQDRGEGIKTIYNLAKKGNYTDPKYIFESGNTIVVLNFASIKTYETKILEYLKINESIGNKDAREITGEEDKEKIKNVFKRLERTNLIERVDINAPKSKVKYKLKISPNVFKSKQLNIGFNQ